MEVDTQAPGFAQGSPQCSSVQAAPETPARPYCPRCVREMVLRRAQNGPNAGKEFRGCSMFVKTKCGGVRSVESGQPQRELSPGPSALLGCRHSPEGVPGAEGGRGYQSDPMEKAE